MTASILNHVDALLIDLDGTVYQFDQLLPGAGDTLAWLRGRGVPLRFVTNSTMRSRSSLAARLRGMGVQADEDDILNPVSVAAHYLREHHASAYLLVLDDALTEFEGVPQDTDHPDFVVIGDLGDAWTFDRLNQAFRLLLEKNAGFIALGKSRYWRAADGLRLDSGPFVTALEFATGRYALVMGKPERAFFQQAINMLGLAPERVAMIGDDIDVAVAGAQRAGLLGALVKTGKFRPEDLAKGIWPNYVYHSLADLRD